jgi:lipopolysaccharide transport system ATP-binding protein
MMPALRVEGLGKQYRIGAPKPRTRTLGETLTRAASAPLRALWRARANEGSRAPSPNIVWALRDVTFELPEGEVLGIIGRNGAGKSTLLKILSRITTPTTGYAEVLGRVGSLLEVGTGFHPELTGRENVYLNGAILGMSRAYVARRFDEIVDFAGIGEFIDTPVKRYSSGMHLRLAFAVAAHLEPEILIIDEVLAVGDAEFQRKCLQRMDGVARGGRTVLFVSHNLNAVERLCPRSLLLEHGRVVTIGPTVGVVDRYLATGGAQIQPGRWLDLSEVRRTGSGSARFRALRYTGAGENGERLVPGGPLTITVEVVAERSRPVASLAVTVTDHHGTRLVNADTDAIGTSVCLPSGRGMFELQIEALHLEPGNYLLGLWLADRSGEVLDRVEAAARLEVREPASTLSGVRRDPRYQGLVHCEFTVRQVGGAIEP